MDTFKSSSKNGHKQRAHTIYERWMSLILFIVYRGMYFIENFIDIFNINNNGVIFIINLGRLIVPDFIATHLFD